MKTMEWGELGEVVRCAVDEMHVQRVPVTPGRVEHVVNAANARMVHQEAPKTPGLEAQVRAELSKPANRHVIASVDEASGVVHTYLAPTPPGPFGPPSPSERAALEQERDALLAALPGQAWTLRVRSEHRVREIQRLLDAGRRSDEAARRDAERVLERRRERGE